MQASHACYSRQGKHPRQSSRASCKKWVLAVIMPAKPIIFKSMQQSSQEKGEQNPFKQKVFDYVAELVSNEINLHLYVLLLLLDNFQFIAYYNNGLLSYNSLPFNTIASVADYLNLLNLLQRYNINALMVPLFFLLNLTLAMLLVLGYRAYQRKLQKISKTVADRNYHKNKIEYFINLMIMLYTTVLVIPMYQCSLTAFYCDSANPFASQQQCYVGPQIIIAAMGFLNLAWLLFLNFFVSLYYYNRNPFSTSYSTVSSNWYNLGRFMVKAAPMTYLMYDPTISFPILFLIVMNISYPAYLFVFSRFLFGYYRYNFRLQQLVAAIEAFTCFFNTGFIWLQMFQDKTGQPSTLLLFWGAAGVLLSLAVAQTTEIVKRSLIKQVNSIQKKSLPAVLQYLIYLIYQTERNFQNNQPGFFVVNIARTHSLVCQDPACYCQLFLEQRKQANYHKDKQTFYTLLLALVDRIIKQNKKAYQFFILKAYILHYKMQSQIKAATTISIIMSDKLDFSDEMLVKGLLFELNQQYNDTRDMEIYRKFNEFLLQQEEASLSMVDLYLCYWQQLIDQKSSLPKLQHTLRRIKQEKLKIQGIVEGALAIFNNHVRVLFLYKTFLKEVLNDHVASLRYEQRYKIGLKQSRLSNVDTVNKIQFRPNENLLVINFTRNYLQQSDILGSYKIVSISSNIREFLGYSNTQLKNSSINKLIPRIYHKCHDRFLDAALEKRDADIESYQLRIFPVNSSGNIIECNLISKFMPSIAYGINIVSFLEQCDVQKDQYYLIYDAKTGIVDSMTKEAENILKDTSRRSKNHIFAADNDFIGHLLPHWDYKQEIWRDTLRNIKSIKSELSLSEGKIDVKHIEVVRSDGWKQKDIKILKFKGSFFSRMSSLSNESERLQREMYVFDPNNMFTNLNTIEIQHMLHPKIKELTKGRRERAKSANSLIKPLQDEVLSIEELPSKFSRVAFTAIQCCIFFFAIGLTIFEFTTTNLALRTYTVDIKLIFDLNYLQSLICDVTYAASLTSTHLAYSNSTMVLPFQSYKSSLTAASKLAQMNGLLSKMFGILNDIDPILISKVENKEIKQQELQINAKYLQMANTKVFFVKTITIVQAIYQFISYGRQFINNMIDKQATVSQVLPSPYYFFIAANSLDILPDSIINTKNTIMNSANASVTHSFTVFLVVKLLVSALLLLSIVAVLLYYRHIYQDYILQVFSMYEHINLESIKVFEQKCRKYKQYLKQKTQVESQDPKPEKSIGSNNCLSHVDEIKSSSKGSPPEEQLEPLHQKQNSLEVTEVDQYISFESKPALKGLILSKVAWIVVYGILLFILCFSYKNATKSLSTGIATLNNHTLAQITMMKIRLETYLSLNLINYWGPSHIQIIEQQLSKDFALMLELLNNTAMNFTAYKPYLSAKYTQLKLIQHYRHTNDSASLNQLTQTFEATAQDMDPSLKYLLAQCTNKLAALQKETLTITTYLNIYISFSLVYILIYWVIAVRSFYKKLLEEHEIAYEMHNIIGLNLRREIQPIK